MTTRRQVGWQKLFLILTVLPCCWSLRVSIPEKEYKVAKGNEITLSCSFVPAVTVGNSFVLTWAAFPDVTGDPLKTVASYFINNPIDIASAYEGRVFMEVNMDSGTSTLRFTEVTITDSRSYQCSVRIAGDTEGSPTATTSLLVLVPPTPPICTLQGQADFFHDVTLSCKSEEGSPPPVYKWTSYGVGNIPRQFPPKTTEKDGVLSLFNISRETSGFYICESTNEVGFAKCNFTLAVMPSSMNIGATVGIIGGVIAGLLVLGILIYCFYRRKSKKGNYAEGSPAEMEFHDTKSPEAGKYLDDDPNSEKKPVNQAEDKDVAPQSNYSLGGAGQKFDDDRNSYNSGNERYDGKGSDTDPQRYRGSRDRLDDQRERYGSRDRLDDQREHYSSRDRIDDQRERYGSRDRVDDRREHYGSRDRLDDQRERHGSRDRLDDQRERHGSRDRLDDQRERYGSRDRLDDRRDRYGGSRDRLEDDRYRSSRDDVSDHGSRQGGSRDRLDYGRYE
ncbi:V-set and immunoglobulin domain-containing protein 1-like [Leuresthes tenuis]|uniref:V-set and immunoglobulin domain-containing protein 1-like n=1 Tax=Leuresthes tenuis TaxID=355514 RepID=UPI003B502AE3